MKQLLQDLSRELFAFSGGGLVSTVLASVFFPQMTQSLLKLITLTATTNCK